MIDIAQFTGEVKDAYVEVATRMGVKRLVKPMFAFPLIARPYKEWVTAYKDKFMAVIAFEQGVGEFGVMLGLVPLENNSLPPEGLDQNVVMFSEHIRLWFDDVNNEAIIDLLKSGGKIKLGDNSVTEPALLGDISEQWLNDLADLIDDALGKCADTNLAISQLTVSTAVGPSSVPINVASFVQLQADFVALQAQLSALISNLPTLKSVTVFIKD